MNKNLKSCNFYLLRTPLLAYSEALPEEESIDKYLQNPAFCEALYLSSPDLYAELQKNGLKDKKLKIAFYKYLLRASYRCTPFGLFAGISKGEFKEKTNIQLCSKDDYRRHTRPDMDYLCALAYNLGLKPEIRQNLKYYPNNTLYVVGNQLRYVEYRIHKKTRNHHLVTVDNSEYVQKVLEKARQRTKLTELVEVLLSDEINEQEAMAFINEMIDGQLLLSELEPVITGKALSYLLEQLQNYPSARVYMEVLQEVEQELRYIDSLPLGEVIRLYPQIAEKLKKLETDFDLGTLFQVDMYKPTVSNVLNQNLIEELNKSIELLAYVQQFRENENLKKFKELFYQRYEDREVPLLEVLDNEMGFGYPPGGHLQADNSPLLNELYLFEKRNEKMQFEWSEWQHFLFNKYKRAIHLKESVIKIDKTEVQKFIQKDYHIPSAYSLYAFISVLASSAVEVDKGNFQIFHKSTSGPSAANLLGRFCHLDTHLSESVKAALQQEQNQFPEAILAEIVHINQARIGNISARPNLRDYEIPILIQAGVDTEHIISLNDLWVSVQNNQIILYSKKLNRQIIPRLSSAHNYSLQALPVYHFLCDLQYQGLFPGLVWDWGFLGQLAYLPRVEYDKVILSPAQWFLQADVLKDIFEGKNKNLQKLKEILQIHQIPDEVILSQGDNDLPLNLDNEFCLEILLNEIKPNQNLILSENLFHKNSLWIEGPEGKFSNELIVPLQYKPEKSEENKIFLDRFSSSNVQRDFSPGSEWLYYKIYCGVKTADLILCEVIKPLSEQLLANTVIDKWFFIRYGDPGHHIRLRFQGKKQFYSKLIRQLNQAITNYLETGLIHSLKTDTYKRELERYGFENIEDSEALFFYDSVSTVNILSLLEGDEGDEIRWQLALRGVDKLLNDFDLDLAEKRDLMSMLQNSFKIEFGADTKEGKEQLSSKFRAVRPKIETVLLSDYAEDNYLAPAFEIFEQRSQNWQSTIQSILKKYQNNELKVDLKDLISSYIHMFLNRFLRSKQRLQELVIYDFMFQYYRGLCAKTAHLKQAEKALIL